MLACQNFCCGPVVTSSLEFQGSVAGKMLPTTDVQKWRIALRRSVPSKPADPVRSSKLYAYQDRIQNHGGSRHVGSFGENQFCRSLPTFSAVSRGFTGVFRRFSEAFPVRNGIKLTPNVIVRTRRTTSKPVKPGVHPVYLTNVNECKMVGWRSYWPPNSISIDVETYFYPNYKTYLFPSFKI